MTTGLNNSVNCPQCGEALWGDPAHACPPSWDVQINGAMYSIRAFSEESAVNTLLNMHTNLAEIAMLNTRVNQSIKILIKETIKRDWQTQSVNFSIQIKATLE